MIILMTVLSSIHVNKLASDTKNILVANYNTIDYCRQMIIALNEDGSNPSTAQRFRESLIKQKANVTEEGEAILTQKLETDFERFILFPTDTGAKQLVVKDITAIMLLNMQAIHEKSGIAQKTASNSVFWISLAGTICFLIALTIWFNLPGNIANPIKELTTSIKEIAAQNYARRIHFETHNEFGELAGAFNTMAQKLEEYQASNIEKLMIEKKRIETLINNMKDPVIGLDSEKKILFINNIASQITGLKKEEIVGQFAQDVAMKNDLIRDLVKDMFAEKEQVYALKKQLVKIYADNKESYFEKDIVPIKIVPTGENEEKLIGNVIMLQNITPYKELDFAKTNFIATVSHELKTPISSIKMGLQLLENSSIGTLNDEQKELVDGIKEDAGRLLKITAELLNMTQVESGSIQLNLTPATVEEIVNYAVSANKAAADQKQILIKIKIAADVSLILADKEKTSWVLTNLLSNAIRYSYDNSTVSLEVMSENDNVRFCVADTGQGIPPEYLEKVFNRYFKIPGTKKEGTGLGLSISKEFIEAQGGEISVSSEYGAGSTFTFSLKKPGQ